MGDDNFNDLKRGAHTSWRPIHYLGSKLRILDEIDSAISDINGSDGKVCDLFTGSGTVFLDQARKRSSVAVDIQEYSRVICSALSSKADMDWKAFFEECENLIGESKRNGPIWAASPLIELEGEAMDQASSPDNPYLLCEILEAGSPVVALGNGSASICSRYGKALAEYNKRLSKVPDDQRKFTTLTRHHGGLYFSFQQAGILDAIMAVNYRASKEFKDLAAAALVTTASDISNTVGKQFAQPVMPRNKDGSIKKSLYSIASRDRSKDTWEIYKSAAANYELVRSSGNVDGHAVRADYRDFLRDWNEGITVVYADPPYTRDHYSRFYHVLETIACGDDPEVSTSGIKDGVSRAAYRKNRHQSPFCIKSAAGRAFDNLIGSVHSRGVPLIMSYSGYSKENEAHPRVVSISEVLSLARRYYKNVEVRDISTMSHSRLNKKDLSRDKSTAAETLIVCN